MAVTLGDMMADGGSAVRGPIAGGSSRLPLLTAALCRSNVSTSAGSTVPRQLQHMTTCAVGAAELRRCRVQEAAARQQGAAEAAAAFEVYAADVIAQAAAAGKATQPMQLYLKRALRPEGLMPSDEL